MLHSVGYIFFYIYAPWSRAAAAAMLIKCLAEGQNHKSTGRSRDSNPGHDGESRNVHTTIYHGTVQANFGECELL